MNDFVGKVIAILVAFVLCFIGPTAVFVAFNTGFTNQRFINEAQSFADEVIDTRQITSEQLADFQLGLNSYGPIVDVTIKRYVKTVEPDPVNGGTYTTYVLADNTTKYNQGDQVKIELNTVGYTGLQRLVMSTIGLLSPKFEYTITARVR